MQQNLNHYYNPFKHSFLGFYVPKDDLQSNLSLRILNQINLYQQPVEEPNTAIVWFVVRCFVAILSEMCNHEILCMLKTDNSILTDVTRLYTYTVMVHQPMRLIFYTLTDFIHPIENFIGEWGCRSYWFIDLTMKMIVISHSLIVALLRYHFIVQDKFVIKFGKEKIKNLNWYISIGIPILTVFWVSTDLVDTDTARRCTGKDQKMFLIQSWSSLSLIKTNFKLQNSDYNTISRGNIATILAILRKLSRIGHRIWRAMIASNILEGIIYYKIIKHMIR